MIGVFDSGSGGLTVLKKMTELMPEADFLYFGDLKNAPYGDKGPEELGALTILGMERLLKAGAEKLVSACNSASVSIVAPLFDYLKIAPADMVEMVGPTVRHFSGKQAKKILLIGTAATVRSGIYQSGFADAGMKIDALAMPNLARAIEEGTSVPGIRGMIGHELGEIVGNYDTLILGCTHYSLVGEIFSDIARSVEIFDPGEAVAREVKERFGGNGTGKIKFIISKDSKYFRDRVAELFGDGYEIKINDY